MKVGCPLLAAAAFGAAFLLSACGSKLPEITAVEWRIEMRPAKLGAYESLSVFATIQDDNGIDDIQELWVVQDHERLAWELSGANWTKRSEGSDTWLGAAALVRADYRPLPRGDYRLVAIDAAGDRTEKNFSIQGSFPGLAPPSLSRSNDKLTVSSVWPETLVLAFDAAGQLLSSRPAPQAASSLEELFGADTAVKTRELAAYGYAPDAHSGYYSWRIRSR